MMELTSLQHSRFRATTVYSHVNMLFINIFNQQDVIATSQGYEKIAG
jgi:hypothetical protein